MAMLAARGVSLGLGKINLADLNQKPADKHRYLAQVRSEKKKKPRIIIKKKADPKTIWAACRAVIFGCIIIAVGLAMAILGYFDKQFSERVEIIDGNEISYQDKLIQYQLKSMQYLGPILMGVGCVLLIIACVITLESRDKHTQIITEEVPNRKNTQEPNAVDDNDRKISELESGTNIESPRKSLHSLIDIHQPLIGEAPLALFDSLHDLHTSGSEIDLQSTSSASNKDNLQNE